MENYQTSETIKPLVILEIANNHMGDVTHGKNLIEQLVKTVLPYGKSFGFGVKFQFRDLNTFIHDDYKGSELKYVQRFEETKLDSDEWDVLFTTVKENGLKLLATPFDEPSVAKCIEVDVDFIKIASCSIADWPLVECVSKAKKPVIFSTAGASLSQIDAMVSFFDNRGISVTLMHCVGLYPTPDQDLNLGQIAFYKNRYPKIRVGFSTHEDPSNLNTGGYAFSLGARVFEKHVGLPSVNYKNNAYSTTPVQLRSWIDMTEKAIACIGLSHEKVENTRNEIESLNDLKRGAFAKRYVAAGSALDLNNVFFAIPCFKGGITANDFSKYSKFVTKRNIEKGEALSDTNVEIKNNRADVQKIVCDIREFLIEARINLPEGVLLEISHHYGIENFYSNGMAMVTVVNEEYCKKLLFLLQNQTHPEQFHLKKKETFHVIYGKLELELDGVKEILGPGETRTISPKVRHKFRTDTGCVIEEISTTHHTEDSFYSDEIINNNSHRKTMVNFWL